jgi:proline iminopeptidase
MYECVELTDRIIATIVQGRYDIVCAPQTAWELHKGLPGSRLFWTLDAGHSAAVSSPVFCIGV